MRCAHDRLKRFWPKYVNDFCFKIWNVAKVHENEISLRKWSGGAAHLRVAQNAMFFSRWAACFSRLITPQSLCNDNPSLGRVFSYVQEIALRLLT